METPATSTGKRSNRSASRTADRFLVEILHIEDQGRFQVEVDAQRAYLYYRLPEADLMDIQSVFVPVDLRGRSIGRALAEHAIEYATTQQMRIQPSCPYVRWLMDNP